MKYERMEDGIFLARPNRFLAKVKTREGEVLCHVRNTGRLRELLLPGQPVRISRKDDPKRKTRYSLISVTTPEGICVNLDSQAPNEAAAEWVLGGGNGLFQTVQQVKREQRFGESRFDLYIEADGKRGYMEVKGVTLKKGEAACFPDAPTERGVKHVMELAAAKQAGYEAWLLFVIQREDCLYFTPNRETHPEFADALLAAAEAGVNILACSCRVGGNSLYCTSQIPVRLEPEK